MGKRESALSTATHVADDLEQTSRVFFTIMVQAMDKLHASVSPAGLRALLLLDEIGECSLGELAHLVPLSQSATSRMIDRLVNADLVQRTVDTNDRRQVRLSPTPSGRSLTRDLVRARRAEIRAIAAGIETETLHSLQAGLRAFAASAHDRDSANAKERLTRPS